MKNIVHQDYRFIFLLIVLFISSCNHHSEAGIQTYQLFSTTKKSDKENSTHNEKRQKWEEGFVYVTKVIDGDTFWVDNGDKKFKVRFIGVDAPETRNSRWKHKSQFAAEAKAYVKKLAEYQWVRLDMDIQQMDRYQRLLAYVYLADGTFLNASLVEGGYAVVDTYPPNVKYVDLFIKLQHHAQEQKLGVWIE
ncbi:thermonuclease family protein [Sphingobacterium sp. SRCM116780]|uniref:thermonuclease family protein n=1 Tax=Sphingobacterium sp. SRCM116780 TaxID=2907623 RepID=UPI001F2B5DE3|nr:thermonuclease family protein [Sphingobacterium sp. SRCM116780]UIR54850.1 thermonuclease family protein [Sphingobacterium sp. SRCM116780]